MKRQDIDPKYTWDLEVMYSSTDQIESDFAKAESMLTSLESYKGRLTDSLENLISFYEEYEKLMIVVEKLYVYGHLNCDVEPKNQDMQELFARARNLETKVSQGLNFVELEIIKNQAKVRELMKDDRLKQFAHNLDNILRKAPHMASDEIENFLKEVEPVLHNPYETFTVLRPEFKPVVVDGEEKFLNQATLNEFLKNEDRNVRLQAYENFYNEYDKFQNVFASTLAGNTKSDSLKAKVHNFKDSLEASLFKDNAPRELFEKVLDMANERYHDLFFRYNALKKKVLGLETMYNYDLSVPLVKNVKMEFGVEECFNLIKEATKPFGEEYTKVLEKAYDERWIDYYTHEGKRTGAYSSGSYSTNPNILMNFIGDYSSLSTLYHELGHSVHTYFSNTNQRYTNANYTIFVAEVASTVNETLLFNLMIDKCKNEEEKAYLIYNFLEKCVGLIFRQPMFAKFEHGIHQQVEAGLPLSSKYITELYDTLNKEYFGSDVELHPLTRYSCYAIPHFYYDYYVYKYTVGMCVALAIVNRILNGDSEQINKYLKFLKSGGSKYPIDLLKNAGVDPTQDNIYEDAFNFFKTKLNELENILIKNN